ncbi:MAG: Rieske (2Fe-2S) protein, partial [Actinomycetota bacterium]|nr:Rieske (2Fe-2S) protein [Actinomycetota bacterium]
MRMRVGSLQALQTEGRLLAKAGGHGVCVFWHEGRAYALDDRCPHMGFPLHRGTVEAGLVTCHWHHARFDLVSGGTLDPFADDARPFAVEVEGDDVYLMVEPASDRVDILRRRLAEGLEGGLTLVTAKATLGLLEAGVPAAEIVRVGMEFGTTNRAQGWGSGLTVLVAMANLLPSLDGADRGMALVHGLAFVARDTANRPPRFALTPLGDGSPGAATVPAERLADWYRRFIETRSGEAAERTLATALAGGGDPATVSSMMMTAVTDHVFVDVGHTLDFTNKAFEALEHLGWAAAATVLPTLTDQTAAASRSEEGSRWRHPHDLVALISSTEERLPGLLADGAGRHGEFDDVSGLGRRMLDDDPYAVVASICGAIVAGATPEQLGRALALAAALRITRFHVQNDFGDWDSVHHG